jgi:hypothetical protein
VTTNFFLKDTKNRDVPSIMAWEHYRYYALICDEFIARVYFILFKKECPSLTAEAKKMISKVGHWYLEEATTYIRVFGATSAPHLLPTHVPDWLIVGEICYQTILQGYNATLVKDKKREFIPYDFHVGFYMVKYIAQTKKEGLSQLEYRFPIGRFHKHDPKGLVPQHESQVSSCWKYVDDKFEYEIKKPSGSGNKIEQLNPQRHRGEGCCC